MEEKSQKELIAFNALNKGKYLEAEILLREIVSSGTNNYAIYGSLAILIGKKGNIKEMLEYLKHSTKLNPKYAEGHFNLGIIYLKKGDFNKAIDSFLNTTKLRPKDSNALNMLGVAFFKKGNIKSSISYYSQAIELNPQNEKIHNNLAIAYSKLGNLEGAISTYLKFLKIDSNNFSALFNLGKIYQQKGDLENALKIFEKILKHKNSNSLDLVFNEIGITLQKKEDFHSAIKAYLKAIKINKKLIKSYNNLGYAQFQIEDFDSATSSFLKAIKLDPEDAIARKNLSKIYLLKGNYKEGLKNYEYRYKQSNIRILPHAFPNIPIWSGEDSERPEKLLIVSEQGLGDTLQFMRFLPLLRKKNQKVYFCAQEKLHGLIKNSKIDLDPLSPIKGNKFSEGKWIPLLSLPKILDICPKNKITKAPYINSDESLINKWKLLFSKYEEKIIGIHWQGNPETEKGIHKGRSLLLNEFSILATNSKCKFLSLQKGYGEEQIKDCSFKHKFVDFQKEVDESWDFVETSSIIANCDLIITSDSAVAHLAGGMGKKTWLLLQKIPDWRWGLKGSRTFWYENMEIFRQVEKNNWRELMLRVSIRLKNYLNN